MSQLPARNLRRDKKSAGSVFVRHFGVIMLIALGELALRVLALSPLYAILTGFQFPGLQEGASLAAWGMISILLFLFAVMPARYAGYAYLRRRCGGEASGSFGKYLTAGLRRVGIGLLWGISFIGFSAFWLYGYNGMDMKMFFSALKSLSALVGGTRFDTGVLILLGAIVVTGIVYAYGWWRSLPADFVSMKDQVPQAFRHAKQLRSRNKGIFWRNALINMLLTLPSAVLALAVLLGYFVGNVSFANGAFAAAQQLMTLLRQPLPQTTLLYLALILVFVHLPLCAYRKTRDAALVTMLEKAEKRS